MIQVSGGDVSVVVSKPSVISASAGGSQSVSVVAQRPQPVSATVSYRSELDTAITNAADGDVLRYSQSKWRNYSDKNLVDGGNW